MTRITRDSIGYLVLIGFCLLLLFWAIPTYTPEYPGYGAPPAMVPNVAVCVMLVMATISLIRNIVARRSDKPIPAAESEYPATDGEEGGFTQVGRVNFVHLARVLIPCVLLLLSIDYIGYVPASLLFLVVLQFLIGSRQWVRTLLVSAVLVAVLYIIMRYGFGVPIPGPQLF